MIVQPIQYRKIAFAWHAKNMAHALRRQLINQQMATQA